MVTSMRLTASQQEVIRRVVRELAGDDIEVRLFGSRLDPNRRGGDVDLLVTIPQPVEDAAWLESRIAGRISRLLDGRRIDVLVSAPNLKNCPVHEVARREGVLL